MVLFNFHGGPYASIKKKKINVKKSIEAKNCLYHTRYSHCLCEDIFKGFKRWSNTCIYFGLNIDFVAVTAA